MNATAVGDGQREATGNDERDANEEPAEARGRLRIADKVLERIATHALAGMDELGGVARRVLGVPLGQDSTGTAPRVEAHVDGRLATLRMTVSVLYPAPVRQVARRARDLVTNRVGEFTGLDIRQVDIDVATLIEPESQRRRVT
jgi:uncharacterized alkaline shock family protein YloU